jgi:hypothetical protein
VRGYGCVNMLNPWKRGEMESEPTNIGIYWHGPREVVRLLGDTVQAVGLIFSFDEPAVRRSSQAPTVTRKRISSW